MMTASHNSSSKLLAISLFVLILTISSVQASPPNLAQPPLQAGYAGKLEAYLQAQMKTYKIPGMAVAVVRDGEVEYINGLGAANANGDPVTPDTPFLLASVSKSITAVGVMQLIEDGKIKLDDPVKQHLPWFEVSGGRAARSPWRTCSTRPADCLGWEATALTCCRIRQTPWKSGCAAWSGPNLNSSRVKGMNTQT